MNLDNNGAGSGFRLFPEFRNAGYSCGKMYGSLVSSSGEFPLTLIPLLLFPQISLLMMALKFRVKEISGSDVPGFSSGFSEADFSGIIMTLLLIICWGTQECVKKKQKSDAQLSAMLSKTAVYALKSLKYRTFLSSNIPGIRC